MKDVASEGVRPGGAGGPSGGPSGETWGVSRFILLQSHLACSGLPVWGTTGGW